MTLNFLAKRRITADCQHRFQMRIEIAGMSREVCEACGRVSVAYVEDHFQPERGYVDLDDVSSDDAGSDGEG